MYVTFLNNSKLETILNYVYSSNIKCLDISALNVYELLTDMYQMLLGIGILRNIILMK